MGATVHPDQMSLFKEAVSDPAVVTQVAEPIFECGKIDGGFGNQLTDIDEAHSAVMSCRGGIE